MLLCRKKMIKLSIPVVLTLTAFYSNGQSAKNSNQYCELGVSINGNYSKARILDSIMRHYTTNAMPGASVAVYSEKEGWWAGSQGYASLENKIPMQNCHLQYQQSVSKTYMAAEILM